jgi:hypothetical protein
MDAKPETLAMQRGAYCPLTRIVFPHCASHSPTNGIRWGCHAAKLPQLSTLIGILDLTRDQGILRRAGPVFLHIAEIQGVESR